MNELRLGTSCLSQGSTLFGLEEENAECADDLDCSSNTVRQRAVDSIVNPAADKCTHEETNDECYSTIPRSVFALEQIFVSEEIHHGGCNHDGRDFRHFQSPCRGRLSAIAKAKNGNETQHVVLPRYDILVRDSIAP